MIANVGRKSYAYRSIRSLFIIGLVGLILAACGVIWLLGEYAKVAQDAAHLVSRAAMYKGSWVEKQDPTSDISSIEINSNGLNMTIHVSGNCHEFTYWPCDMGTYTHTFTGEPFTIFIVFNAYTGDQVNWPLVINLSNTDNTKLQVWVNNYNNDLFEKT